MLKVSNETKVSAVARNLSVNGEVVQASKIDF